VDNKPTAATICTFDVAYTIILKFGVDSIFEKFLKTASFAHHGCRQTVILWNVITILIYFKM